MDLFDHLPISALVNEKLLCVHGGISTDVQSVRLLRFSLVIYKR